MRSTSNCDDSQSVSDESVIDKSMKRSIFSYNFSICKQLEGKVTVRLRKRVVVFICLGILAAFAIYVAILTLSLSPSSSPENFSSSNCGSRLQVGKDRSTGVLKGVKACGRRAWDSEEIQQHLVYLTDPECCLDQEFNASLEVPVNIPTSVRLEAGGRLVQKESSQLKFAINQAQNGASPHTEIEVLIKNHISMKKDSSLTFLLPGNKEYLDESTFHHLDFSINFSLMGNARISLGRTDSRRGVEFKVSTFYHHHFMMNGNVTMEVEGRLRIGVEDRLIDIQSGTLQTNLTDSFVVRGNLHIKKGAVLELHGFHCMQLNKEDPNPVNITLEEGQKVIVTPQNPYEIDGGRIECDRHPDYPDDYE